MKHWKLTRWVLAALLGFHASLLSAQEQPAISPPQEADILQMLKEDLAVDQDNLSSEDADHIRRLKRLHELRTETIITEPAGAELTVEPAVGSELEEHVWDLDAEVQRIWKELADLRRSINERSAPAVRSEPGIDEPIPFDSESEETTETRRFDRQRH